MNICILIDIPNFVLSHLHTCIEPGVVFVHIDGGAVIHNASIVVKTAQHGATAYTRT